jgi:hypothetical protein
LLQITQLQLVLVVPVTILAQLVQIQYFQLLLQTVVPAALLIAWLAHQVVVDQAGAGVPMQTHQPVVLVLLIKVLVAVLDLAMAPLA